MKTLLLTMRVVTSGSGGLEGGWFGGARDFLRYEQMDSCHSFQKHQTYPICIIESRLMES